MRAAFPIKQTKIIESGENMLKMSKVTSCALLMMMIFSTTLSASGSNLLNSGCLCDVPNNQANVPGTPIGIQRIYSIAETPASAPNTVKLTVITGASSNYVWAQLEGTRYVKGSLISQTSTQRTWEIVYRPTNYTSHTAQISANHAYILDDKVVSQMFPVTLSAPFVNPANPVIHSATAGQSNLILGETTTIAVETNTDADYVWAEVNGRRVNARRTNTSAVSSPVRTWTINIRPEESQIVAVYARASSVGGVEQETTGPGVNIRVNEAVPEAIILRASASSENIIQGDSTTITVRTNSDTTHVWAEVDGRRVNARRQSSSSTTITWTIDVRPRETRHVTIFAGTRNNNHDDMQRVRINVRNESVSIRDTWAEMVSDGRVRVTVITNTATEWVDIAIPGRPGVLSAASSTNSNSNEVTWTFCFSPVHGRDIAPIHVFAGSDRAGSSDSRIINMVRLMSGWL
ncbi:MAG: hypothetical protein FWC91_12265 [Defluviitaleaceae bacterium]|nr:hypothetical protein [Defluviitaleaceae bacterium]